MAPEHNLFRFAYPQGGDKAIDFGCYDHRLASENQATPELILVAYVSLNRQFVEAFGGLVDGLMGHIARHGNDGNNCADYAHRHGQELGEKATA